MLTIRMQLRIIKKSSLHLSRHLPSFLTCNRHCLWRSHMEYLNKG